MPRAMARPSPAPAAARRGTLLVTVEDALSIGLGHAGTGVGNLEDGLRVRTRFVSDADADAPPSRRELEGVRQHVVEAWRSLCGSASTSSSSDPSNQGPRAARRHRGEDREHRAVMAPPDGAWLDREDARLDAARDEDAVDPARHLRAHVADLRHGRLSLAGRQVLGLERLGDEVERRERVLEAQRRDHIAMLVHDLRHPLSSLGLLAEVLDVRRPTGRGTRVGRGADARHVPRNGAPGRRRPRRQPPRGRSFLGRASRRPSPSQSSCPMLAVFTPVATRRRVALEFDGSLDLEVYADPQKLRQALDNLLANALKFTPRGGRVRVRVVHDSRCSTEAVFGISDSGPGVAPQAERETIFDRYHQGAHGRAAGGAGPRVGHRTRHRRGAPRHDGSPRGNWGAPRKESCSRLAIEGPSFGPANHQGTNLRPRWGACAALDKRRPCLYIARPLLGTEGTPGRPPVC